MHIRKILNERLLQLEGAYNVRDIGGYETKNGRVVQRGRFFRSDGLHRLTERDKNILLDYGIRTMIDLRHELELEAKQNVFANSEIVEYLNISLLNPAHGGSSKMRTLGDMYVYMLEECKHLLCEVFKQIATTKSEVVLYHCTAGKDRTGVITALLLSIAGVNKATIVADYADTEQHLVPLIPELRNDRPANISEEVYERFLGSAPTNMEQMLNHLTKKYGDAENYLLHSGLTVRHIDKLKMRLLSAEMHH